MSVNPHAGRFRTVTNERGEVQRLERIGCTEAVCCDVRCPEDSCLVWDDWCGWCQANEEPPGAGADPYGRTAEDWALHAE